MIVDDCVAHFQPILVPDECDEAWWVEQQADTFTPLSHEPPVPSGSLAWWVEMEAAKYRMIGTEAGEMVFETLWQLAQRIRFVDARTPAEYLARVEVLDADGEVRS